MIWKIQNQKYKYYLTRHECDIQNKPDYKKYHDKNKDKINEHNKEYYKNNKDIIAQKQKMYNMYR